MFPGVWRRRHCHAAGSALAQQGSSDCGIQSLHLLDCWLKLKETSEECFFNPHGDYCSMHLLDCWLKLKDTSKECFFNPHGDYCSIHPPSHIKLKVWSFMWTKSTPTARWITRSLSLSQGKQDMQGQSCSEVKQEKWKFWRTNRAGKFVVLHCCTTLHRWWRHSLQRSPLELFEPWNYAQVVKLNRDPTNCKNNMTDHQVKHPTSSI